MIRLIFTDEERNLALVVQEKVLQRYSFIENNDGGRCKECEFQTMCAGGYTNPIKCFFNIREDGRNGHWIVNPNYVEQIK